MGKRAPPSPQKSSTNQLDDLFGDAQNNNFAFSTLTSTTGSSFGGGSTTKKPSTADPFDAFNDNFSKNTNVDKFASPNQRELMFRAFGATAEDSDGTDDAAFGATAKGSPFEDEFSRMDDVFSKLDISNNNNTKPGAAPASNDFANFDVFSTISNNFKSSAESLKRGAKGGFEDDFPVKSNALSKFGEDYSRDDDFGADLEAVMERSKLEK